MNMASCKFAAPWFQIEESLRADFALHSEIIPSEACLRGTKSVPWRIPTNYLGTNLIGQIEKAMQRAAFASMKRSFSVSCLSMTFTIFASCVCTNHITCCIFCFYIKSCSDKDDVSDKLIGNENQKVTISFLLTI